MRQFHAQLRKAVPKDREKRETRSAKRDRGLGEGTSARTLRWYTEMGLNSFNFYSLF